MFFMAKPCGYKYQLAIKKKMIAKNIHGVLVMGSNDKNQESVFSGFGYRSNASQLVQESTTPQFVCQMTYLDWLSKLATTQFVYQMALFGLAIKLATTQFVCQMPHRLATKYQNQHMFL